MSHMHFEYGNLAYMRWFKVSSKVCPQAYSELSILVWNKSKGVSLKKSGCFVNIAVKGLSALPEDFTHLVILRFHEAGTEAHDL